MIFLSLRIWQTWWQSCHRFPWIAPSITCQTSLQASGSFCPIWDMRVTSFFQRYDLALIGNMIIYSGVSHRYENLQYRFLLTWTLPRGFGEFPQLGFNFERPHITYPISIHFPNIHGPLRVLLVARQPLQLNLWGGIRHNAVGSSQLGVRLEVLNIKNTSSNLWIHSGTSFWSTPLVLFRSFRLRCEDHAM